MSKQLLYTMNINANLHGAAGFINKFHPTIIPGIVAMDCPSGNTTVVVYRHHEDDRERYERERIARETQRRESQK